MRQVYIWPHALDLLQTERKKNTKHVDTKYPTNTDVKLMLDCSLQPHVNIKVDTLKHYAYQWNEWNIRDNVPKKSLTRRAASIQGT